MTSVWNIVLSLPICIYFLFKSLHVLTCKSNNLITCCFFSLGAFQFFCSSVSLHIDQPLSLNQTESSLAKVYIEICSVVAGSGGGFSSNGLREDMHYWRTSRTELVHLILFLFVIFLFFLIFLFLFFFVFLSFFIAFHFSCLPFFSYLRARFFSPSISVCLCFFLCFFLFYRFTNRLFVFSPYIVSLCVSSSCYFPLPSFRYLFVHYWYFRVLALLYLNFRFSYLLS